MFTVRKRDKVKVLWGKDAGKEGEIIYRRPDEPSCSRRQTERRQATHPARRGRVDAGGIKDKELYLPISEGVMLICTECKKATCAPNLIRSRMEAPIRVCRKCGSTVAEPKKR